MRLHRTGKIKRECFWLDTGLKETLKHLAALEGQRNCVSRLIREGIMWRILAADDGAEATRLAREGRPVQKAIRRPGGLNYLTEYLHPEDLEP